MLRETEPKASDGRHLTLLVHPVSIPTEQIATPLPDINRLGREARMGEPTASPGGKASWQIAEDAVIARTQTGCTVMRDGQTCVFDATDAAAVGLFATGPSLSQILREASQLSPPIPPLAVMRVLSRLRRMRMLHGTAPRRDLAARLPLQARLLRLGHALPTQFWTGGGLALVISALVATGAWLADPARLTMPTLAGWQLALALVAIAAGLWLTRALVLGLVGAMVGEPGAVVRLRPTFDTTTGPARARSRQLAWAGLASMSAMTLCALGAARWLGSDLATLAGWLGVLAVLADLAPWLNSDAGALLTLRSTADGLDRRARAWLARRAWRNALTSVPMSAIERTYAMAASLSLLHVLGTLLVATRLLLPAAATIIVTNREADPFWFLSLLPALLVLGVLFALFLGLARVLLDVLRQLRPTTAAASITDAAGLASEVAAAAAGVPFLAKLGDAALQRLPEQMRVERYKAGATILRQGDPGDRLCCLASGRALVEVEDESGLRHVVARLESGAFFGETALLEPVPRTAHVVADGEVSVLSLDRAAFLHLVADAGVTGDAIRDQLRITASLKSHPLFAALVGAGLGPVLERVRVLQVPAQTLVVREGEPGEDIYVVQSGDCQIERAGQVIARLGPGDWFGELALVTSHTRTACVRATTDARLVCVPPDAVALALSRDPDAALRLWQVAEERLANLELEVAS